MFVNWHFDCTRSLFNKQKHSGWRLNVVSEKKPKHFFEDFKKIIEDAGIENS